MVGHHQLLLRLRHFPLVLPHLLHEPLHHLLPLAGLLLFQQISLNRIQNNVLVLLQFDCLFLFLLGSPELHNFIALGLVSHHLASFNLRWWLIFKVFLFDLGLHLQLLYFVLDLGRFELVLFLFLLAHLLDYYFVVSANQVLTMDPLVDLHLPESLQKLLVLLAVDLLLFHLFL